MVVKSFSVLLIELAKFDVINFSKPDVMRGVFAKRLTFGKTDPNIKDIENSESLTSQ